jgi:hypothetical protein
LDTAIAFGNRSTVVTDTDVASVVKALKRQITRDFVPTWGTDANIVFFAKPALPPKDAWIVAILDDSDQAGALGYHDITSSGLPLAKVFAKSDKENGLSWTVTASHELIEMLGDPEISLTIFDQTDNTSGRLFAYEFCDACEPFPYQRDLRM